MKNEIHLVMPMAGNGMRFFNEGFDCPKPLIEIHGKPFFYWSAQSICKFIDVCSITFVVLMEHVERFGIEVKIREYYPDAKVIVIPNVLNGAVLTCLEGVRTIDDKAPIMFNDCDHLFKSSDFNDFIKNGNLNDLYGAILTFESDSPQYSYVRLDEQGRVTCTIEKKVISNNAICGAYYFKNVEIFRDAVKSYRQRCRYNEFFLSGVYDILIEEGMRVGFFKTDYHISFGTPEEYRLAESLLIFGDLK